MKFPEWDNLPKNKHMILLRTSGDESSAAGTWYEAGKRVSESITNLICTVYNTITDKVTDKSAYKSKEGRLYINCGAGRHGHTEKLFLDDFKTE